MADSIIARFGMDNSGFKKGMKENQNGLSSFKQSIKGVGTALIAAFSLGSIKGFLEKLDGIGKAADEIGVTVEELQKLRFAAEQTGGSADKMDAALRRLNKTLGEAQLGTGEGRMALEELGIELKDNRGQIRSNISVLRELADKISKIQNPATKAALVNKILGESAGFFINTIRNGSADIDKYGDQLERVGGVIDVEAVRAAETALDNLNISLQATTGWLAKAYNLGVDYFTGLAQLAQDAADKRNGIDNRKSERDNVVREDRIERDKKQAADAKEEEAARDKLALEKELSIQKKNTADIEELNNRKNKELLTQIADAEKQIADFVEKHLWNEMSLTERKQHLERKIDAERKKQIETTGNAALEARLKELEAARDLQILEQKIHDKRLENMKELNQLAKDHIQLKLGQMRDRAELLKAQREQLTNSLKAADAEQKVLIALQQQAVERAALAGGRERGLSKRAVEYREKAQLAEDQGRFGKAARYEAKADALDASVVNKRKERLYNLAKEAERRGDMDAYYRYGKQAKRAGFTDSEGRDSTISVARQMAAARQKGDEDMSTLLREQRDISSESLTELRKINNQSIQ